MHFLAPAVVFLSVGVSAPPMEYLGQFDKIALTATSFQTCEKLGFSVDRQGISDWIKSAKANAIAAGIDESEARTELEMKVDYEWQRVLDRHARALLMQHSPDHVWRNNRYWQSRCEELANDPSSSQYFSHPQT